MTIRRFPAMLALCLPLLSLRAADATNAPPEGWQTWFPGTARLQLLAMDEGEAYKVAGLDGAARGWVFRTDRVPPRVPGMRGEIGTLVGIGLDGRILGIRVVQQREDAKWFARLKQDFYASFRGLRPDAEDRPDTVTGATVSSGAIVRDVFESSRTLLALPEVQAALKTRTPAEPAEPAHRQAPGGGTAAR
jgi:hypothetical protein